MKHKQGRLFVWQRVALGFAFFLFLFSTGCGSIETQAVAPTKPWVCGFCRMQEWRESGESIRYDKSGYSFVLNERSMRAFAATDTERMLVLDQPFQIAESQDEKFLFLHKNPLPPAADFDAYLEQNGALCEFTVSMGKTVYEFFYDPTESLRMAFLVHVDGELFVLNDRTFFDLDTSLIVQKAELKKTKTKADLEALQEAALWRPCPDYCRCRHTGTETRVSI